MKHYYFNIYNCNLEILSVLDNVYQIIPHTYQIHHSLNSVFNTQEFPLTDELILDLIRDLTYLGCEYSMGCW